MKAQVNGAHYARHLITLVYYGLGDGEIRCLAEKTA